MMGIFNWISSVGAWALSGVRTLGNFSRFLFRLVVNLGPSFTRFQDTLKQLYFVGNYSLVIILVAGTMLLFHISKLNKKLKRSEAKVIQQNKELVENGEELRKAKEQAENASRMKTTFIQSMSHEIRTPLNSIVGFSQVLSNYFKEEDNDEIREFASIIEISSSNLLRLINDVKRKEPIRR